MFESVKIQKRKFPFVKIILFVIFSVIVLFLWRIYLLHRLPMDYLQISATGEREKLAIPPRPGVQGIVITGPKIQPLFFSIDLSRAGVRQLDWQQLRHIDTYTHA